jgi:hypothetical protein
MTFNIEEGIIIWETNIIGATNFCFGEHSPCNFRDEV